MTDRRLRDRDVHQAGHGQRYPDAAGPILEFTEKDIISIKGWLVDIYAGKMPTTSLALIFDFVRRYCPHEFKTISGNDMRVLVPMAMGARAREAEKLSTVDGRILLPRPKLTRAQAWAKYEKWSKAAREHPLVLGRARIAYELEIFPWAPADYLDEGETPFADDRMIVDEIDACNAEAGRNIGGDSLWPMVKARLLARGYRVKKKQVLSLMPEGTLGRPPHGLKTRKQSENRRFT